MLVGEVGVCRVVDVATHAVAATSAYKHTDVVYLECSALGCGNAKLDVACAHLVNLALGPCVAHDKVALGLACSVKTSPLGPYGIGIRVGVFLHIHTLVRLGHNNGRTGQLTFVVLLQSPVSLHVRTALHADGGSLYGYFYALVTLLDGDGACILAFVGKFELHIETLYQRSVCIRHGQLGSPGGLVERYLSAVGNRHLYRSLCRIEAETVDRNLLCNGLCLVTLAEVYGRRRYAEVGGDDDVVGKDVGSLEQ